MTGDRATRVSRFQMWDRTVVLGPDGVRLVLAAIELAQRGAARRNGGAAPPSTDLEWLCATLAAADGAGPGTAPVVFRLNAPPSVQSMLTVTQAAELLGIKERAVRKRIAQGGLGAERHGHAWLCSELAVRQAATRRRHGTEATASGHPDTARPSGPPDTA